MLARGSSSKVKTVAICAGSGASMLKNVQADAWFTGEASHHELLAATAQGISVILCKSSKMLSNVLTRQRQPLQHGATVSESIGEAIRGSNERDPDGRAAWG
jgi:putative NIF3 family GTP cyclohydrolase 1 type 2